MTQEDRRNKLVQTKLALAEKYTRLAKVCKSKPRRASYLHRVAKYRQQAKDHSLQG